MRLGSLMKMVFLLCLSVVGIQSRRHPKMKAVAAVPEDSPLAASAEDPHLGHNTIFRPVPSCLSEVILVVYVQSLELLERLDVYKDMYGPFFAGIEFYVDGTWCDPRARGNKLQFPCYGAPLNRSTLPEEVRVVDKQGGGWLIQLTLIDAIQRSSGSADPAGFFLITDDVLLNLSQFTRAVHVSGCGVIWRAPIKYCEDLNTKKHTGVINRFKREARRFLEVSGKGFKEQLERNLGSQSTLCMGTQVDFVYIPSGMATAWARAAQQMTDSGLIFAFPFFMALFGIAPMENMIVLRTQYLFKDDRADSLLKGATFHGVDQPYCWSGTGNVSNLLGMHIIHPNKIAFSEKSLDFARTLNPPEVMPSTSTSIVHTSDGAARGAFHQSSAASDFWCSN